MFRMRSSGRIPVSLPSSLRRSVCAAVGLLWLATVAEAQVSSTIQGRITDASGGVLPGGAVTVTNVATGLSRTGHSATDGYYRIPDLLPGNYEVRVEFTGFKTLVRQGIVLDSETTLNLDLMLELGQTAETLTVVGQAPQIETTESRISEVIDDQRIQALPSIGRGLAWLATMTAGIQGLAESPGGLNDGLCCDALSAVAAPRLSSGGNENKSAFFLDGIALHYGDGSNWALAFTPNPDAVEEMRVSTNPTSAQDGVMSGPLLQMVTKSGTNAFNGTGHYTFLDDSFNEPPFGSERADIGNWYQRYYGGTIGGPLIRNRLFFFAGFEGVRERRAAAGGSTAIVETEAFKNWVTSTRPNSIAAQLLKESPPFRYATDDLIDVNRDGIMDIGTVTMDRPNIRKGEQFNIRMDYQTASAKDRFYGTFWRSQLTAPYFEVRPTWDLTNDPGSNLLSLVNTHTFSSSSLNELRVATLRVGWETAFVEDRYHLPCILTDDGLSLSTFGGICWTFEDISARTYDVRDTFTWYRGSQQWKVGGSFRSGYKTDPLFLFGDTPNYSFANIIDFANDRPYQEERNVDGATGQLRDVFVEEANRQISLFGENSWGIRRGLTLNLGLRWDYYAPFDMDGIKIERTTFAPRFTSDEVTPAGIIAARNQEIERSFDADLNNFSPRVSIAWTPDDVGRTVVRGGLFVLHDEISTLSPYRSLYANPPVASTLFAGPQFGIPIVYGIAQPGSRNFPVNPGLVSSGVDPALGIFRGTRPSIAAYATDFEQPTVYDANVAVQRQVLSDLAVTVAYHYRRTTNDIYEFDANRFIGDLVDGQLDRLNPHYEAISTRVNWGRRRYHGVFVEGAKRLSRGWQVNASYAYNNGRTNLGPTRFLLGGGSEAFNPELDWARDEPSTHTAKLNAIWDVPFLRGRGDLLSTVFGNWQLATIWNIAAGAYFTPISTAAFGSRGDFNGDGWRSDRPDLPAGVPTTFTEEEWLKGALNQSMFPSPTTIRNGTMPRSHFKLPGYARVDLSLAKKFPIGPTTTQFQIQAQNLLNSVNIATVSNSLTSASFGRATGFYPMRTVQLSLKVFF